MIAEIITIGEEILIGQIVDSNSAFIGENLNSIGIKINRIVSVSDKREDILDALKSANDRADLVLMTGGLGPTKDDITKQVLCEYFNTKLVPNRLALENIERIFNKRRFSINELNRKQAEVPESCEVIINKEGTAPAMMFNKDNSVFISLPGVPFEMENLISKEIIPRLKKIYELPEIIHKTVMTQGAYEGMLAQTLEEWENELATKNISVAYLPSPGIIKLRLTKSGWDRAEIIKEFDKGIEKLDVIIPGKIFGFDDDTLPAAIGKMLKDSGKMVVTAESCTGGNVGHMITSVSGSSLYYKGGVLAYSNEIKQNILNVKEQTLIEHGAVSEAVVSEMSANVLDLMNADYSIAVSGIAGPLGGTDEKPVGTTWIAVASRKKIIAKKYLFGEHRGRNITKASLTALNMLRLLIKRDVTPD